MSFNYIRSALIYNFLKLLAVLKKKILAVEKSGAVAKK